MRYIMMYDRCRGDARGVKVFWGRPMAQGGGKVKKERKG